MFRIVLALIFMQLMGCSVFPASTSNSESNPITLELPEPNRIQFQGKGAGAGIALMSTMGPVGIALGVAIDEGIAKDIRKAISEEQSDVQEYLKHRVITSLSKQGYEASINDASVKDSHYPKLVIKRMGFKITNGSTDATAAEWSVEVLQGPDKKATVNYPKDFKKDSIKSHVLADLKANGKLGVELLDESLMRVMDKVNEYLTNVKKTD